MNECSLQHKIDCYFRILVLVAVSKGCLGLAYFSHFASKGCNRYSREAVR